MSMPSISCPCCASTKLRVARETRAITASDGTELRFEDESTRCSSCGEEFYTREQSLASSRAAAGARRNHDGLLGPDEIRSVREKYKVTQAELESVLGVGPKTVVRWERGTVSQGKAVDTLLRVFAENAHEFWKWAERRGVAHAPVWSFREEAPAVGVKGGEVEYLTLAARVTGEWVALEPTTKQASA